MGHVGWGGSCMGGCGEVGHVEVWGWSCRGGWGGVGHVGVGWVM